jgi:hypothetical protein
MNVRIFNTNCTQKTTGRGRSAVKKDDENDIKLRRYRILNFLSEYVKTRA